jgi:hypothetical protein
LSRYWVSFDLALGANYDDLYRWLDENNAKECGDSLATFTSDSSMEEVQADLEGLSKSFDARARVYIIGKAKDKGYTGKFVIGGRKQAPWAGYGQGISEIDEAS